jgi:hypothetical protein
VSRLRIELDARGEVASYELLPRQRAAEETRRLWKAMMLAPTLEVCEALLRGEVVPVERLDPDWVKRFGIKQ